MTKRHLLRVLEREREAHAAERARLIETLCTLAGKPLPPKEIYRSIPVDEPKTGEELETL